MNYIGLIIFIGILLISNGCGTAGKSFDTSNAASILNGTTTRSEIKKIFGEPFKTGIQNDQPVWTYENHHYSILRDDTSEDLIIIFRSDGIVQSHQFMSSKPSS
jgi:outer membrane protein assembly factor BamE (lipoprotein component of BamABCDE complex)